MISYLSPHDRRNFLCIHFSPMRNVLGLSCSFGGHQTTEFSGTQRTSETNGGCASPSGSCSSGKSNIRGARFSIVPKVFGRMLGDKILFVFSKRRRLEPRDFAVILILKLEFYELLCGSEKFSGLSRNDPQNKVLFFLSRSTFTAWSRNKPACSLI